MYFRFRYYKLLSTSYLGKAYLNMGERFKSLGPWVIHYGQWFSVWSSQQHSITWGFMTSVNAQTLTQTLNTLDEIFGSRSWHLCFTNSCGWFWYTLSGLGITDLANISSFPLIKLDHHKLKTIVFNFLNFVWRILKATNYVATFKHPLPTNKFFIILKQKTHFFEKIIFVV